jgi:hypothetical protein
MEDQVDAVTGAEEIGVPKVHPATRPVEPEDPMNLFGYEVPGDPDVMLRILIEEFARLGFDLPQIMQLCRDPFYQGMHGLWLSLGEEEIERRIVAILSRFGVMRTTTKDAVLPESLVQLTLAQPGQGETHACRL